MDYIVRATAADNQMRIFAATTAEMVETARRAHHTSDVATAALGRLLTAGAMMGSMMKNTEDMLTLQINCAGPVKGITVTASLRDNEEAGGNKPGECVNVKGYVKVPDVVLPLNSKGKLDVQSALGAGMLSVIKDMGLKEPFVGQTELVSGEIAEDLTYYFASSEQVPSSVALGVLLNPDDSVRQAGGFIVQLLPFAEDAVIDRLEEKLKNLKPITTMLDSNCGPEAIISDIFGEFGLLITDTITTQFKCNCDKERVSRAIQSVSRTDIEEMIADGKPIEVNCHFCGRSYSFSADDLRDILKCKTES